MNLLLKRFSYVTFILCRIQNDTYPCASGFSSKTTGTKTRHENMCGNTGIDADDFTDGDHGKDLFLHVNYLCKPLSLFIASVYVLYWKSIHLFTHVKDVQEVRGVESHNRPFA